MLSDELFKPNLILKNELYQICLNKIIAHEKERIFCCHQMDHYLDVARIAWILNLEEKKGLSKDLVYGAALLHDIGRFEQYENGTPHEIASLKYAEIILDACEYKEEEKERILAAIEHHRNSTLSKTDCLSDVIYRADKMSRACFSCKAKAQCDWKNEKKNLELKG